MPKAGVEFRDIASGKILRVLATAAAYDILANGPKREQPCRQIDVLGPGELLVTGTDGVDVLLPSAGQAWSFVGQFIAIKSGTATNIIIYY
jgi:hypothetical protein